MSNVPAISFKKFIKRIEKMGFNRTRQKGSHIRFQHPDGRKTTIPDHGNKSVPKGLLLKILKYDIGIDPIDFFND